MAPARKSRSVKRFSYVNEVLPNKDGESTRKSMQRKRKLSDMLGSRWSKEELLRFYEAYRKHRNDWKKVAAAVRNRSVEMVEALFTLNKAYLSLPEGTATVAGLIAMMTDYYSNLEGSDSDQESNDGTGTSRKPSKHVRGRFQSITSKGSDGDSLLHSHTVASSFGCLSSLKKRRSGGSRPRAVGKRTPRFPVSYSFEKVNGEKFLSPARQILKLKVDANDDDVAHEVALALAEASQRGGSPQVSQTPNRRTQSAVSSPVRNDEKMHAELELTSAKLVGSEMDEDCTEASVGSMEADNEYSSRDRSYLMETEGVSMPQKGRRLHGKKLEVDESANSHLDDVKEACSGTEEQKLGAIRGKLEIELAGGTVEMAPSQVPGKKSKKVLFRGDESSAFDALQTLADLSLMMPAATAENDSTVQVKEEDGDLVDRRGLVESISAFHQKDRLKSSRVKAKGNRLMHGFEDASLKTSKLGRVSVLDRHAIPEAKQESHQSTTKMLRKKQKTVASKILKTDTFADIHLNESQEAEGSDVGEKLVSKGKRSSYNASQQKHGKLVRHPEHSSLSADLRKEGNDSAISTTQVPVDNQVNVPTKFRRQRKADLQKPQFPKDLKLPDKISNDRPDASISSAHDRLLILKEKLLNCLSNNRVRRWCAFEWFYSAVDYPWFAKKEFVEYLYHVGLGHVPRLTRVEWGVIRSSLGKPRRFSEQFLKEEKEKLNQYRNSVRTHYTELRAGTREGLPTDLVRPLSVGQRVMAIHPRTREIHDGSVLTVDQTRCRVQFDRPELGVEFVLDIDCMPLNPLENIPASLASHNVGVDKFLENLNELKMNVWAKDHNFEAFFKFSPGENLESFEGLSQVSPPTYTMSSSLMQVKLGPKETANNQHAENSQPSSLAQVQAKEADVQALAELTRALDKKEAVVSELRHMNDGVMENQKYGNYALNNSESFRKQYSSVLLQLNEANEQVSYALHCLRQRNTYQGNSSLMWPRPTTNFGGCGSQLSTLDHSASHMQDLGSHVNEIVEGSRMKARTMVDAAVQAMSSLNGRKNNVERIEEAIDYVSNRLPLYDSCMAMRTTPADQGNLASQDQLTSCTLDPLHVPDSMLKNASDGNEIQVPSEFISHCIATFIMIQKCTERQFPPADVAQILDSAVTSLQPCCSQNLPVYAEIQKCMGIIRSQILALIPT